MNLGGAAARRPILLVTALIRRGLRGAGWGLIMWLGALTKQELQGALQAQNHPTATVTLQ